MKKVGGFSLIELMVVMAIVAILSFAGVSQIKDYTAKAKVTEALALLEGPKLLILEELLAGQSINDINFQPIDNLKHIRRIELAQGNLIATIEVGGNQDLILSLEPINQNGIIDWQCHSAPEIMQRFAPRNCR